jgi:tetratricopeptide (TPR) repeat protein
MTLGPVHRLLPFLALGPLFVLSACGPSEAPRSVGGAAPFRSPIDAAIDLLNQGDEKGAQKQLKPLLRANPNDPAANVLLESIQRDPVELLGAKSFSYKAQPGDTMLALSQRFLGNRLKFYQLARYNHLDKPAELAVGTMLRIPGEEPRAAPPSPEPIANRNGTSPPASQVKSKAKAPDSAAIPSANPAAAFKLRGLGLTALNQGQVASAVALLRRASALDPTNSLIARDLARAERIARTVRAHR